jgi:hypothetical protein
MFEMYAGLNKKHLYTLAVISLIIVATFSYIYFNNLNRSEQQSINYKELMKAWGYLKAQIVRINLGEKDDFSLVIRKVLTLVREHPDSNVLWLNDAWLVAKALEKLYPQISTEIMETLACFNFTADERWSVIFGDINNFVGPFGLKEKHFGSFSDVMSGETFEIKAWVPDRESLMHDFAEYADLLALAVMFESYAGYEWKALKLYKRLKGMWNETGLVDFIAQNWTGNGKDPPHFDTYKLALALIAAQFMRDYSFADELAEAIMKNQCTQEGKHRWGFITWYQWLGETMNKNIPTNVETTALSLIALSPFIWSSDSEVHG